MHKLCLSLLLLIGGNGPLLWAQSNFRFADSIRTSAPIPELAYAVVKADTIVEMAALGKHSLLLPDTATLNDRFHIGSNTKAMTAFMIARYVEKGKLKWTSEFFDYFPAWKKKSRTAYAHITLQQLLSHRAGIQPFQGIEGADPVIPSFKGSRQEKRKQFAQFVLTLAPVTMDTANPFIYSNAGYTLAALMLEKATGKSWEALVEKIFNDDLKLQVKFSWPDNQQHKDTWGHLTVQDTLQPMPSTWNYHLDYTEPAGDLNIRMKDYCRFIQLQLQGIQGRNNYLKASTYAFLHNAFPFYSLGWFNVYEQGKEWSVHAGTGAETYFSIVHINRTDKIAYIIFANAFNEPTRQAVRLLMRKLKGR